MASPPVELRWTIDREWLRRRARREPLAHAYALWDLERFPERTRFVSVRRGEETVGYLLVWLGEPGRPRVHWFGELQDASDLVSALPTPPFVAFVPPEVSPLITAARGEGTAEPIALLLHDQGSIGLPPADVVVRRLAAPDRDELAAWTSRHRDPLLAGYGSVDPGRDVVWGAFEGPRLVGVGCAEIRLGAAWVLSGVYVDPGARGRGIGRALVGAAIDAAGHDGAPLGVFVREDQEAALRLYGSLGFRRVGRRVRLTIARSPRRAVPNA